MLDLSASAHVVVKLPLKLFTAVAFAINFNKLRFFNINFQPAAGLLKCAHNFFGHTCASLLSFVNKDPVAASEVNRSTDRALSHDVFIASNQLVLL